MKKKYSVQGFFQFNDNEKKEFTVEYENSSENEENNQKLIELLDHPLKFIIEGKKYGATGIKRFISIILLFGFTNTILFLYAVWKFIAADMISEQLPYLLLVLGVGLGATAFAGYRGYQYLFLDTIRVIYKNTAALFKKICDLIIDQVESVLKGKKDITDGELTKALNFANMVNDKLAHFPKLLRKGLIFLLNKVPFVGILLEMKEEIMNSSKQELSDKLFQKMDDFITTFLFSNVHTKWVWWMLPLNIFIMITIIKMYLG